MTWSATIQTTQLNTPGGVPQLEVVVKLDNGEGLAPTVTIFLGLNEGRNELKQKINNITTGLEKLGIVKADLADTPQVDTSPSVVTDIQAELNAELNILNQIQNLVKLGKIKPDDNVVTEQIEKFAEVANKIIKTSASLGKSRIL